MSAEPIQPSGQLRIPTPPPVDIIQKKTIELPGPRVAAAHGPTGVSEAHGAKIPVTTRRRQLPQQFKPFPLGIAALFGLLAIYFMFAPLGHAAKKAKDTVASVPNQAMATMGSAADQAKSAAWSAAEQAAYAAQHAKATAGSATDQARNAYNYMTTPPHHELTWREKYMPGFLGGRTAQQVHEEEMRRFQAEQAARAQEHHPSMRERVGSMLPTWSSEHIEHQGSPDAQRRAAERAQQAADDARRTADRMQQAADEQARAAGIHTSLGSKLGSMLPSWSGGEHQQEMTMTERAAAQASRAADQARFTTEQLQQAASGQAHRVGDSLSQAKDSVRDQLSSVAGKVTSILPESIRPGSDQPLVCPTDCVVENSEAHFALLRAQGHEPSMGEKLTALPKRVASAVVDNLPNSPLPESLKPITFCPPGCVNARLEAATEQAGSIRDTMASIPGRVADAVRGHPAKEQLQEQHVEQQHGGKGFIASIKHAMGTGCPYLEATGQDAATAKMPHSHPGGSHRV